MKESVVKAEVVQITPLTDSILQLILAPKRYINYKAGQYLQIILGDEALSYSIANAPLGSRKYEIHIRHSLDNPCHQLLLAEIKQFGMLTLKVPLGLCEFSQLDPEKPILFIAAGTGFAPIKAMIEQLLAESDARMFELFWGARSQSDLYMDDMVLHWQAHVSQFLYVSQCSELGKETLSSMILAHHPKDLCDWQMVISGPFEMVYSTRDMLLAHGVARAQLFSDAFAFENAAEE